MEEERASPPDGDAAYAKLVATPTAEAQQATGDGEEEKRESALDSDAACVGPAAVTSLAAAAVAAATLRATGDTVEEKRASPPDGSKRRGATHCKRVCHLNLKS